MPKNSQQQLADLEELILRIPNQKDRQYFDEAVQCYFNGALRASVILSWIVGIDNLTSKLELLAKEDGEAKKKWSQVKAKRDNDETFESDLINAFGPGSLDIYDLRQMEQLQYIRRIRNWCAHATDYQPTPEEVRHCLRLVVDIILAAPVYRGYRYITRLSEQIKDTSFLPEKEYDQVVDDVLKKLRPGLYKTVAAKLVEVAFESGATPSTVSNVKRFLGGMLHNILDETVLQDVLSEIKPLIFKATGIASDILAERPEVFRMCDYQERERLMRYLLNDGYAPNKQDLIGDLIRTELAINRESDSIMNQVKEKYYLVPRLIKEFAPRFAEGVFDNLIPDIEYAGYNNFHTNNEATAKLRSLGIDFFDEISDSNKVRLVHGIIQAAVNGSGGPMEMISKPDLWPNNWLRLLVYEIPSVLSQPRSIIYSPSLVATPLAEWAKLGEALPETWIPILKLGEENKPNWYGEEAWKLYDSLHHVCGLFEKSGNRSLELENFVEDIIPF